MFCPSCGTENQDQVKFCRRCGVNLSVWLEMIQRGATRTVEPVGELSAKEHAVRVLTRKIEQTDPKAQTMWGEAILPSLVKELRRMTITPEERREKYIRSGMVVTGLGMGLTIFLYLAAEALASSTLLPEEIVPLIRVAWAKGLIPLFIGLMMILYGLVSGWVGQRPQRTATVAELEPEKSGDELFLNRHSTFGSVTEQTTQHLEIAEPDVVKPPVGSRRTAEP